MQRAFTQFDKDYKPAFKFVVVKKRVSTRFFRKTPRALQNPTPGTVVDTMITKPNYYDFFLVSQVKSSWFFISDKFIIKYHIYQIYITNPLFYFQFVGQGTATPSHYNVIHDECPLKPHHVQLLAYKLCHLYYNWPGTIRVPAPTHYAHR